MTLGTTWAVRGQFGHEQGAAWAGGIGALCLLVLANRSDWNARMFQITLAAAVGWGLGGMMSYGLVVGYGHGVDFVNVYYGLAMLFVIGGLYGFLGGGLFGLALSASTTRPVNWLATISYLVAGAVIGYFFLVEQWGMRMTPPRSELWAACLGMALLLSWHLWYEHRWNALQVAVYSALGAGFGFAFGNFLQVLGKFSGLSFNFWNVMEYALGFFGGLGMAFGTMTASWHRAESDLPPQRGKRGALLALTLLIPLIIWKESFTTERLGKIYGELALASYIDTIRFITLGSILVMVWVYRKMGERPRTFFSFFFLFYILLSLCITGAFFSTYRPEQYLYLLNYGLIMLFLGRAIPTFEQRPLNLRSGQLMLILALAFIAVLALIAMHTHGTFEGMHRRFEI